MGMQSVIEKKFVAVEKKLTELSVLSKEVKRLDKQVTELRKKIDAPKDWRLMVGRLKDTKISREADALGREFRRNQTQP
jgi:predicted  nucleic acid-binding Zn-ribbon protein